MVERGWKQFGDMSLKFSTTLIYSDNFSRDIYEITFVILERLKWDNKESTEPHQKVHTL